MCLQINERDRNGEIRESAKVEKCNSFEGQKIRWYGHAVKVKAK